MSKPNYRAILSFDAERKLFLARAPELEHCTGEGATRAEACAKLEEEIDAQLANMLSHGSTPPKSVDEEEFSGEVSGKLSKALHKELAYLARSEGVEIAQLVSELLAAGVESRRSGSRGPRSAARSDGNRADGNRAESNGNVNGNGNFNGNRGGRGANGTQFLDDRANFIEYVRTLDQSQSQPTVPSGGGHRGPPNHGGHGGHGGGGGGAGGANRGGQQRRRGGGGGGGQQARGGHGGPNHGGNPGNGRPRHSDAPRTQAAPAAPTGDDNPGNGARHHDE